MKTSEKIISITIIGLIAITLICSELNYSRAKRELRDLTKLVNEAQQSVITIGEGVRQQESLIREIGSRQSDISSSISDLERAINESSNTIRELIESESGVDGTIGAIRGTAKQLEDSLRVTISGLSEDEI